MCLKQSLVQKIICRSYQVNLQGLLLLFSPTRKASTKTLPPDLPKIESSAINPCIASQEWPIKTPTANPIHSVHQLNKNNLYMDDIGWYRAKLGSPTCFEDGPTFAVDWIRPSLTTPISSNTPPLHGSSLLQQPLDLMKGSKSTTLLLCHLFRWVNQFQKRMDFTQKSAKDLSGFLCFKE